MTTARKVLRITVPAVIGAAAAAWLAPMVGPAADAPTAAVSPERTRIKASARAQAAGDAAEARRTAARWARATAHDSSSDESDEAEEMPPSDDIADALVRAAVEETPEDLYARLVDKHAGYADRFAAEGVDARWATAAQTTMRSDFAAITEAMQASGSESFELRDVACRSTMCVVQVEWDSASTAIDQAERIALARFEEPCALFLLGPSPDAIDRDEPFMQDVYFDCA